ncbi:MAG: hypothetical protein J2P34_02670 [Actinobacteria bacterium]|nr:hypothetical protein [Actinomycetota bacterium]
MTDFTDPEQSGRPSATGGTAHQPFDYPEARPTVGGHPHGKPASWVLIGTVIVAFLAGGAALILHLWWLFWVCVGVVVLSVPAGKAIRIMDDTVIWGSTAGHDRHQLPGLAEEHASAPGSAQEE